MAQMGPWHGFEDLLVSVILAAQNSNTPASRMWKRACCEIDGLLSRESNIYLRPRGETDVQSVCHCAVEGRGYLSRRPPTVGTVINLPESKAPVVSAAASRQAPKVRWSLVLSAPLCCLGTWAFCISPSTARRCDVRGHELDLRSHRLSGPSETHSNGGQPTDLPP